MHVATVYKAHQTRNDEKEVGVLQSLAILEYIAIDNAQEIILKNEDVGSVQEQDVSIIEETNNTGEMRRAISENASKSANGEETVDMDEFAESRKKGISEWNIEVEILEWQDGDCREVDNREVGEVHVNNSIG